MTNPLADSTSPFAPVAALLDRGIGGSISDLLWGQLGSGNQMDEIARRRALDEAGEGPDNILQRQRDSAAMERLRESLAAQEREAGATRAQAERERAAAAELASEFQRLMRENGGDANTATRTLITSPVFARAFAQGGSMDRLLASIRGAGTPVDPGGRIVRELQPRFDESDPVSGQSPSDLARAAGMNLEQSDALRRAAELNPTATSTALSNALTARALPQPEAPPARNTALDREAAKRLAELQRDGDAANTELVNLTQLQRALETNPGGMVSGVRGLAAQWGINTGRGTTDLQIVNSLIDRLTPAQRQGLPGAASDRDVAMFRNSLPSLWQTPEGQRQVIDTLRAIAEHRVTRGHVASRAIESGTGIEEAFSRIRGLPDPMRAMSDRRMSATVQRLSEVEGVNFLEVPRMTRPQLREFNTRMIQHYGGAANIPPLVRQLLLQRAQQIDAAGNPQ